MLAIVDFMARTNMEKDMLDKNEDLRTPLELCARGGLKFAVMELLSHGAFQQRNGSGQSQHTPLIYAIQAGFIEMALLILNHFSKKVDRTQVAMFARQPLRKALSAAVQLGQEDVALRIMKYLPDAKKVMNEGDSPMVVALKGERNYLAIKLANAATARGFVGASSRVQS